MQISHAENHGLSVYAGQGEHVRLRDEVRRLAEREKTTPDEILIACKDDYHQTAAHIAAKAGQTGECVTQCTYLGGIVWGADQSGDRVWKRETRADYFFYLIFFWENPGSIEALAKLFTSDEKKVVFFNMANRFSGDRPVHTAMRHGYLEVLKAVVRHGGDPTVANRFGDKVVDYEGDYDPDEVKAIIDGYLERTGAAAGQ